MRRELEDAAREGSSRRSNSPIPVMPLERAGSLSDLTGNVKAAGFFSDGIPKNIHMKFVSVFFCWIIRTKIRKRKIQEYSKKKIKYSRKKIFFQETQ